ncbi:Uu.00g036720.m01.CDS01 [Anthostomella pinea]|uniref:Uu.00g036720.m01.CDS01 n=1 Tax=Anthostomella pinea TaxID=933095 RepID=A0AAI8YB64_9PEZI|nr:Uu.00g036720.m01.CDS01 [Anthostomella pinea]
MQEFSDTVRAGVFDSCSSLKSTINRICRDRYSKTKGLGLHPRKGAVPEISTWIDRWVRVWKCRDLINKVTTAVGSLREAIGPHKVKRMFRHRLVVDELPTDLAILMLSAPVWEAYQKHIRAVKGPWPGCRDGPVEDSSADGSDWSDETDSERGLETTADRDCSTPLPSIEQDDGMAQGHSFPAVGCPTPEPGSVLEPDLPATSPTTLHKLNQLEERAIIMLKRAKGKGTRDDVSILDLAQAHMNREPQDATRTRPLRFHDSQRRFSTQANSHTAATVDVTSVQGPNSPSSPGTSVRPISHIMNISPTTSPTGDAQQDDITDALLLHAAKLSREVVEDRLSAAAFPVKEIHDATGGVCAWHRDERARKLTATSSTSSDREIPPYEARKTASQAEQCSLARPSPIPGRRAGVDSGVHGVQAASSSGSKEHTAQAASCPGRETPAILREFNDKQARNREKPLAPQRVPYRCSPLKKPTVNYTRLSQTEIRPVEFYTSSYVNGSALQYSAPPTQLSTTTSSKPGHIKRTRSPGKPFKFRKDLGRGDDSSAQSSLGLMSSSAGGDYEISDDESLPSVEEIGRRLRKGLISPPAITRGGVSPTPIELPARATPLSKGKAKPSPRSAPRSGHGSTPTAMLPPKVTPVPPPQIPRLQPVQNQAGPFPKPTFKSASKLTPTATLPQKVTPVPPPQIPRLTLTPSHDEAPSCHAPKSANVVTGCTQSLKRKRVTTVPTRANRAAGLTGNEGSRGSPKYTGRASRTEDSRSAKRQRQSLLQTPEAGKQDTQVKGGFWTPTQEAEGVRENQLQSINIPAAETRAQGNITSRIRSPKDHVEGNIAGESSQTWTTLFAIS